MNHFKGINETERFNNDLLNEARKTNELLSKLIEQNAQLLKNGGKENVISSTKGIPVNSPSKEQPRQRNSNRNSGSRNK